MLSSSPATPPSPTRGSTSTPRRLGRELKVRYILEGSIQRGGSRLRVNAQLIDATTGAHLWADRFDKPMADPFDTQDEIVSRLANQLRPELMAAEARRAEHEENPDSVDLYFLGLQVFGKGGVDNIKRARDLFERAVALDPGNVDALVGAARAGVILGAIYGFDDRASTLAEAETLLIKGISIAPRNFWAHLWLGFVLIHTNRAAARHRRTRAGCVAESQSRRGARLDRASEDRHGPSRRGGGAHQRGLPAGARGSPSASCGGTFWASPNFISARMKKPWRCSVVRSIRIGTTL